MPSPKDILLINPWIYDFTAYDFWLKPLGFLHVASLLNQQTGYRLSFIDCLDRFDPKLSSRVLKTKPDGRGPFPKEEVAKPEVLEGVPRRYSRYGIPVPLFLEKLDHIPRPDLVLMTCTMTYWYPGVQHAVELIREKFGAVPIALGGIYATLLPGHAQRASGADFICEGPAEKNLASLLKKVFGEETVSDIPTPTSSVFLWPDYSLLRDKKNLPLMTSRGCPYSCSFCSTPLLNPVFVQESPSAVIDRIEFLVRRFHTKNMAFYDDALLINKKNHIVPILEGVIRKKIPVAFHTPNGLHIKELDAQLAVLLRRANFVSLYLSQESFDEDILEKSCPKVKAEDLAVALAHLEKAGYRKQDVNIYLIVGLPDQDIEGVKEGILRVRQLGARPRLSYFSPVPQTPEWRKAVVRGYIPPEADPLLHNKLTFPYLWGNFTPADFDSLRDLLISSK